MNFEEYLAKVQESKKLSAVKVLILKELWGPGLLLDSKWVSSKSLLDTTKQKYFDRRARELIDSHGCDIATEYITGHDHAWILKSTDLNQSVDRRYLTAAQKTQLFVTADFRCSTCGVKMNPGVRGLQADHKIPLSRNGSNEIHNWQPVCNNCNVGKRRACESCDIDCNSCSWAFPETVGIPLMVKLSNKTLTKIRKAASALQLPENVYLEHFIDEYIK
ncbi:MAG: HNH endonuclease [Fibrobacteres bacterium]|nr:HNH endonuclease [Fibrobacterota bacterium]